MSDLNVTRFGLNYSQANGGSPTDTKELFYKVFSGEVGTAFEMNTVFKGLHRVRGITNGKSAAFPHIGSVSASYHQPGAEIVGSNVKQAERVISIDQLLQASVSIANIDEAMSSYDVRSPFSTEIGRALAYQYDKNVGIVIAQAARTLKTINDDSRSYSGATGGISSTVPNNAAVDSRLRHSNALTVAATLVQLIWNANQVLDEKNVPSSERFVAVRPAQFYLLVSNDNGSTVSQAPFWMSSDYGGSGSLSSGMVPNIGPCRVVMSNNMPTTDTVNTANSTGGNDYSLTVENSGNKQAALVWQKEAAGTVQLLDLATEMDYSVRHQATLLVSKYAVGHGVLRPECAAEITAWSGS